VPYLDRLGISHIYASPIFTARSGSTHGYDITDANAVNPELGGRNGLARLVGVLRQHHMGLVLDIVPNHMASAAPENAWFSDVLRNGRTSRFADYFDIDWDNDQPQLTDKMLLPILAKPYAAVLQAGEVALVFDRGRGEFFLAYFDRRVPLAAEAQASILATAFGKATPAEGDPTKLSAARVARAVAHFDAKTESGRKRMHELLEAQHYRLAFWQNAADEINWRRFFEISDLIGMRVELDDVFEASHALIFELYREGLIDGVRVDHVDGLALPEKYTRQLRARLAELHPARPAGLNDGGPLIWVEKILADDETLESAWRTDGTTGYEFINDVLRVLVDPEGEAPLTQFWATASGNDSAFDVYETRAREQILSEHLAGEFERICVLLNRLSNLRIETRDVTGVVIRRAIYALLVNFRVYRIYSRAGYASAADKKTLERAAVRARELLRPADHPALNALLVWFGGTFATPEEKALLGTVIARFEQLSAPLAAKAVEDTAFYRYGRLLALNEVGGSPGNFSLAANDFHARMVNRHESTPLALSPLATHDHKRGADARARLAVLSERPEVLGTLARDVAKALQDIALPNAQQISPSDLLMLLQSVLGAWQPMLDVDDTAGYMRLRDRLAGWQNKALREAKQHSNWLIPVTDYEAVAKGVLEKLFEDDRLRHIVYQAVQQLSAAGAVNSLVQVLLQCTSPGIPDIYQGTEMWDFSLVDPDNRLPVDFAAHDNALDLQTPIAELLVHWRDGRIKQALVARILNWRREHREAILHATYRAIAASGPNAKHVLAFVRESEAGTLLVIAPRNMSGHLDAKTLRPPARFWRKTIVEVRETPEEGQWLDVLSGGTLSGDATLALDKMLGALPIAMLYQART
jgi:(1->4)-alpha-D-glucan 1-alpha-D-glucosylmutase